MRVLPLVGAIVFSLAAGQPMQDALRPAGSILLPTVEGRIDHLAIDLEGHRIFLAALGSNSVEVIDIDANRVVRSLFGFHEPQGIRFLADAHRVVVANGGDGSVQFLDGSHLTLLTSVRLAGDADNVRYDSRAKRVYVGYGDGALGALDSSGQRIGDVKLAGHPEAFQLDPAGGRIFVNVPTAGHIAVIDATALSVTGTWPVMQKCNNFPMAIDEEHHRLFAGCRNPARLLVYDMTSGNFVSGIDIVGDTDDLFYDSAMKRIYVIGGGGSVTVLEQEDADHYRRIQTIATAPGARTGLFVPELRRLFVAVPHRGAQPAELRVFTAAH
jgi:DNA-binding beta-propeller fold protein YncE